MLGSNTSEPSPGTRVNTDVHMQTPEAGGDPEDIQTHGSEFAGRCTRRTTRDTGPVVLDPSALSSVTPPPPRERTIDTPPSLFCRVRTIDTPQHPYDIAREETHNYPVVLLLSPSAFLSSVVRGELSFSVAAPRLLLFSLRNVDRHLSLSRSRSSTRVSSRPSISSLQLRARDHLN